MSSATKFVVSDPFIADSSPLILLARIGKIDLLPALAGKVFVPESVLLELRAGSHRDSAASVVEQAPGIEIVPDLPIPATVHAWDLDPGESQVLAHALARQGSWAVLDDRAGRRCAASLGIATIGSLGTVLRARKVGLIPLARPLVEALRAQGLFLGDGILNAALAEVGE
jgi:predicted nucleic acid-binding protein